MVSGRGEIIGAAALIEIEDWLSPCRNLVRKGIHAENVVRVDLPGKVPTSSADGLPIASPLTVATCRNAQSTKGHCMSKP